MCIYVYVFECVCVFAYQAIYESHAQSIWPLVQLHYKHHTQVIREGRGARGGDRERKVTPTNIPCRETHTDTDTYKDTDTHRHI